MLIPTSTTPICSQSTTWTLIFCAWLLACIATLGALFFSELMHIPPCILCWYQRIFMFPLVMILPIGLFPLDRKVVRYTLPLAVSGWLIAVFHLLLVAGLIPDDVKPCTQGIPCAEDAIVWFGFVTIPLLSFAAFSIIIALLFLTYFRKST